MKTYVYVLLSATLIYGSLVRADGLSQQFNQQSQEAEDTWKAGAPAREAAAKAQEDALIDKVRTQIERVVTAMAKPHGGIKQWDIPSQPLMTLFPGVVQAYCSNVYYSNTCDSLNFETNDNYICQDSLWPGISYSGNIYANTLNHYDRILCVRDGQRFWMGRNGRITPYEHF